MRVLIIEDEPQAARRLERLVRAIDPSAEILNTLDSIQSSVLWLTENEAPDLIFMDIQLGDGDSFQIFEKCSIRSPVIFTTAYDAYALKAFKVNSIDYILKPVDEGELAAAIQKYKSIAGQRFDAAGIDGLKKALQMLTQKFKERFVIKVGEHLKSVPTEDILFFFSLEKATFAQSGDGRRHLLDFTLDEIEGMVNPDRFFRVNRKYVVSAGAILDMIAYTNSRVKVILKTSDDKDVVVSRERVQEFKEWLGQ